MAGQPTSHLTYPPSRNKALLRLRANQPLVSVNKGRLLNRIFSRALRGPDLHFLSLISASPLTGDLDGKSAASGWNQRDPWLESGIDLGSDLGGTRLRNSSPGMVVRNSIYRWTFLCTLPLTRWQSFGQVVANKWWGV